MTDQQAERRADAPWVDDPTERTVDEAGELYAGQWILMQVTGHNPDTTPGRGIVVAAGRTRSSIQPAVMEAVVYRNEAKKEYYVFFGFERASAAAER